ncbi:hypothetical protein EA658_09760 [Pseudoxanthomonas winnipegensis]|uniref:Phage protein n=1 Tax=Pseudoxanthomonas winnipegensis TaxID=2480810 RepID=A0ABY1WCQ3_9GAMM|nr:hypothetical protein [Pseudoxanthomonas winnipegensis]TAA12479.1 hypothetical protein EA659_03890 [Pseudoxanthomonas winnipegensis]TAA19156.1 hypothetical protein EA658_09760 [Pseudoxanthomonas winnipegensis]TAH70417.1 hypothetical protein EA657_16825 [Pseudoxanthomonas winnipegensis]
MSVIKGEAPKTISTELPFTGFAEKFTIKVVYNNITGKQYRELVEEGKTVAELVFAVVSNWDAGYPLSIDGITDFEDERPGICDGLLQGYWRARRVDLEKN